MQAVRNNRFHASLLASGGWLAIVVIPQFVEICPASLPLPSVDAHPVCFCLQISLSYEDIMLD